MLAALAGPFVVAAGLFAADVPDVGDELTPQRVRHSIDAAVAFLRSQQRADGSWEDYGIHPGAVTSLCALALLNAGLPPDDPTIAKALAKLETYPPRTTYATSLQTLVFCQANPRRYLPTHIQRNVAWFERTQSRVGPTVGGWSYDETGGISDGSNSQFALLALHEAERAGASVDRDTWTAARLYWEKLQLNDGSFRYRFGQPGTGSMTCAGIGAMIITSDRYRQPNARVEGNRILCCQQTEPADEDRIEMGVDWLAANFSVMRNPGQPTLWLMYYLYGLERVGRLTNRRFIGNHDWYREGAAFLISMQDDISGFWTGIGPAESRHEIATSLALLFLAKGRRPVLIGKLEHSAPGDWDAHRSDVDNLTLFVEQRWNRQLTWQTIDVRRAGVEDLLQAPVLVMSGSRSPLPADEKQRRPLAQRLRDYLDRGGFLLAEANCGSTAFDRGFRELMDLVFPEPEYRLRLLEPQHPIWRAESPIAADQLRPLWGIESGCRTSVVYAAPDGDRPSLSCLWELARPGREHRYETTVQRQIDAGLMIGANILAYATNREIKGKEELFRVTAAPAAAAPLERGRLYIGALRHPGGCNAAPRALANLLEIASQQLQLRVQSDPTWLDITSPALFDHHLVFMSGRNTFHFTEVERRQLKEYLERGGMLFADSICTSPAFTDAFRHEMAAIFPERRLEKISVADPLLSATYGGFNLKTVSRRDPPEQGALQPIVRQTQPDLEGIRIDDRWAVVFSQFDVSCALEKSNPPDCRGYAQQDAARIALNVLLYSLQQ